MAHERVLVTTDVLKLTVDTEGASLVQAEFVKHIDMANKAKNFVLLDESKERTYLAQTGLIAAAAGTSFPTHKTVMAPSAKSDHGDGLNATPITIFSITSIILFN